MQSVIEPDASRHSIAQALARCAGRRGNYGNIPL